LGEVNRRRCSDHSSRSVVRRGLGGLGRKIDVWGMAGEGVLCALCLFAAASGFTFNRALMRRVGGFVGVAPAPAAEPRDPFTTAVHEALANGRVEAHGDVAALPMVTLGTLGFAVLAAVARRDEVRSQRRGQRHRSPVADLDSLDTPRKEPSREWVLVMQPQGPCRLGVLVHTAATTPAPVRPKKA